MIVNKNPSASDSLATGRQRPLFVTVVAIILLVVSLGVLVLGGLLTVPAEEGPFKTLSDLQTRMGIVFLEQGIATEAEAEAEEGGGSAWQVLLATAVLAALGLWVARGLWRMQNGARTAVILLLLLIGFYYGMSVVFEAAAEIFGGEQIVPVSAILNIVFVALFKVVIRGIVPGAIIYVLITLDSYFEGTPTQRAFADRAIRYVLIAAALSSMFIVFLIILFTVARSWEAIREVGLKTMLLGTVWRPGSIIGTEDAQLGLVPMIVGSILSTLGAAVIGVPLSILTAILLSEIAPQLVREIVRPAVELLAGIPSVIYGLFGMVVLAPLIRNFEVPGNSGFGLLNASIILAVMIIPTVTNIAEDAIRAVPKHYKEGSLALGATHWQTIWSVMLPAARSGLIAAVILGIGRALGETMALIMVIGNAIKIPSPLTDNPLTILLSPARTLTGNIAVEINYAAGAHRSALFFTGVLLFLMILLVNSMARFLMRERLSS
jgi:phosphate transport system permease protein